MTHLLDKYILIGRRPVQCDDVLRWAEWFETSDDARQVALTKIGRATVSTVFIGLDYQYGDGPPLLFETMVFGCQLDGEQLRYSTWEEAEAGHVATVERVREKIRAN